MISMEFTGLEVFNLVDSFLYDFIVFFSIFMPVVFMMSVDDLSSQTLRRINLLFYLEILLCNYRQLTLSTSSSIIDSVTLRLISAAVLVNFSISRSLFRILMFLRFLLAMIEYHYRRFFNFSNQLG